MNEYNEVNVLQVTDIVPLSVAAVNASVAMGRGRKRTFSEDLENLAKVLGIGVNALYGPISLFNDDLKKAITIIASNNGVFIAKMKLAARKQDDVQATHPMADDSV